ncbi:hypothetical protein MKK64_04665 [Methylobacterium sp. E-025]|uniref:hypothetical protein n=1 Tax=Methylobacterium sp. E-025 TaxID=2836561 RepID=UPI001FB887EA|nr:hypothetical protein [Methylobacterium sp. E-025]MCJ2110504.1 hypothetical protein [Methylobacterium sp. E-025]
MAPRIPTAEQLAQVREDLALDIGGTGDWRSRVQDEYPDDRRSGEAADMLSKLEASVADIPDELIARYDALWTNEDHEDHLHEMTEDWSQGTRAVGFGAAPSSAQKMVEKFVEEWEAKLAPPQAPEPKPRRRAIKS